MRLCFGNVNLTNFIMEDDKDPSSRLIMIDFEHANFLPASILVYSSWSTRDAHLSEDIDWELTCNLIRIQVAALDNIRRHTPY